MKKYSLYGLTIETDIDFPHLNALDDSYDTDVLIRQGECLNEVTEYLKKSGAYEKKYEIGLQYSCFMNKGGYYVIKDGKEIIFETKEGYTPMSVSAWLLGYCTAMLLLQRDTLAIHCSAVCVNGDGSSRDAFLISGRSGAGKSSLTRKLLERGYKLMADDVAAVQCEDEVMVYPAFPYQKLVRNEVEKRNLNKNDLIYVDEDKDKFLVPVGDEFSGVPAGIKAMIVIAVGDVPEVQIIKLSGFDQLMAVRNNLFLTVLKGDWMESREVLNMCLKMAGKCPVYIIVRPQEGDSLDAMADLIAGIEE